MPHPTYCGDTLGMDQESRLESVRISFRSRPFGSGFIGLASASGHLLLSHTADMVQYYAVLLCYLWALFFSDPSPHAGSELGASQITDMF